ncbi:hypothetical protein D3C86_1471520 [compost metagenome]
MKSENVQSFILCCYFFSIKFIKFIRSHNHILCVNLKLCEGNRNFGSVVTLLDIRQLDVDILAIEQSFSSVCLDFHITIGNDDVFQSNVDFFLLLIFFVFFRSEDHADIWVGQNHIFSLVSFIKNSFPNAEILDLQFFHRSIDLCNRGIFFVFIINDKILRI